MQSSHLPSCFRVLRKACGLLLVFAALVSVAAAGGPPPPPPPVNQPELDPGFMATSLTLLIGGVLLLVDSCRRKSTR